jgi:hypothetical protein
MTHTRIQAFAIALAAVVATVSPTVAQDIGIPACDTFLKSYETCIGSKVPAANQAQMRGALDQVKANWKAVASTADGKKSLEPVCKQTADQLKQQVAALGCTW